MEDSKKSSRDYTPLPQHLAGSVQRQKCLFLVQVILQKLFHYKQPAQRTNAISNKIDCNKHLGYKKQKTLSSHLHGKEIQFQLKAIRVIFYFSEICCFSSAYQLQREIETISIQFINGKQLIYQLQVLKLWEPFYKHHQWIRIINK